MPENKKEFNEKDLEFLIEFRKSLNYDCRLFHADIRVNLVYCSALFHAGVLTRIEAERIRNGLQTVLKRADFNRNYFEEFAAEDVHSFVEARLVQLIGNLGEQLNVGRSRADQSATAFRLWMREEIEEISNSVRDLQLILITAGENQKQAVLPAYEHLNESQPILRAHWCLAYFEMLTRDRERLDEVWRRVNVLPLGSGNAAGTSFEIDREEMARELGFEGVSANSLDAINDADFSIEFVGACSLVMIHLSRLAQDLIFYNSADFSFVESSETSAIDSFLMPKNLDVLELVRGKANRTIGNQFALAALIKNLPLGVHKDTQEIKSAVFDTVDTLKSCLKTTRIVVENIRVNETKMREAAIKNYQNTGELIDYLIHRQVPYRVARSVAGKIISFAIGKNRRLDELSLEEMRQFSEEINTDIFKALSLEESLASKNQIGGTAPERVFEALEAAQESLDREEN